MASSAACCAEKDTRGIITDARGEQYNGMFEDNNHLYRFTDKVRYSPYKAKRPPKKERSQAPKGEKETTRTAATQKRTLSTIYQDEPNEDWSVANTVLSQVALERPTRATMAKKKDLLKRELTLGHFLLFHSIFHVNWKIISPSLDCRVKVL